MVPSDLTSLLQRYSDGDKSVADALLRQIMPQLKRVAEGQLRRERAKQDLSVTELVHEIWLKDLRKGGWPVRDRSHFYALVGRAMRMALIDTARRRLSQRRGSGTSVDQLSDHAVASAEASPEQLAAMGLLMDRLANAEPEIAQVVDMHYFAGFSLEEVGDSLGLTQRQVKYRWKKGCDWLKSQLGR